MTAPAPDPVSGCTAWAGTEDLPAEVSELHDPQRWCGYLAMSTDILWAATMRRWRGVELTEDAVLRAAPGRGRWPYHPSWGHDPSYAGFTTSGLPRWADRAGRGVAPYRVRLPRPDVVAVDAVTVNGTEFTAWEFDGAWLERRDDRPWKVTHDATIVTYRFGRAAPAAGKAAVVELAVELGRAGRGPGTDQACRLPQRLQSVARQGLTYEALSDLDFLDAGLTGLTSVDMWIKSVNPAGRAQEATVWSPDQPRARRKRGSTTP